MKSFWGVVVFVRGKPVYSLEELGDVMIGLVWMWVVLMGVVRNVSVFVKTPMT